MFENRRIVPERIKECTINLAASQSFDFNEIQTSEEVVIIGILILAKM